MLSSTLPIEKEPDNRTSHSLDPEACKKETHLGEEEKCLDWVHQTGTRAHTSRRVGWSGTNLYRAVPG